MNVFGSLITRETNYEKNLRESISQENITLNWKNKDGKVTADFNVKLLDITLVTGDIVRLKLSEKDWSGVGHIIEVDENRVLVQLNFGSSAPTSCFRNFTMDLVWKSTRFVTFSSITQHSLKCKKK
jgi:hypothetical protein